MKKLMLGAALAAAMLAPTVASADTNGVVGIQYGNTDYDGFDYDRYGFNAGFSHDLDNGTFLQFDGAYQRIDSSGCCIASGFGAAHWATRSDTHAFGGFLALENYFSYSGVAIGAEGQWNITPSFYVDGSISLFDFGDVDLSGYSGQIDAGWFITDNLVLTGLLSQTEFDDADVEATAFGVGGEWRFDNSPASIYVNFRNTEVDDTDGDTWMIGVNFDLGTGTLRERRASGPSLNGASALHENLATVGL